VRRLLTHSAGLPAVPPDRLVLHGFPAAAAALAKLKLDYAPGTAFQYSDTGFILLGELVRRVSRERLDPHLDDGARELVAQRQRWLDAVLGPLVPLVDVQVRTAQAGGLDLDQHFIVARRRRGNLHQGQSRRAFQFPDRPRLRRGRRLRR